MNLRPVCHDCAKIRPFMDAGLLAREGSMDILRVSAGRMLAEEPLRGCDDWRSWDWRGFVRSRQADD